MVELKKNFLKEWTISFAFPFNKMNEIILIKYDMGVKVDMWCNCLLFVHFFFPLFFPSSVFKLLVLFLWFSKVFHQKRKTKLSLVKLQIIMMCILDENVSVHLTCSFLSAYLPLKDLPCESASKIVFIFAHNLESRCLVE